MDAATLTRVLIACDVAPTQAKAFAPFIFNARHRWRYGETYHRTAAFLAHAIIETARFTRLEENLFYTTPARILAVFPSRVRSLAKAAKLVRNPELLANTVYAGRLGNGDAASGEGWRYRGRGIFQLTGADNYRLASAALGVDYVVRPELVAQPQHAVETAGWFWDTNGCNQLIDSNHFDATTRRINGPARLHARERRQLSALALDELRRTGSEDIGF